MKLTVYLEPLGCPKNLIDSETMLGLVEKDGFILSDDPNDAEIVIVNTCGFINDAKEESIDKIIELGYLKNNKLKLLVVAGCLAERYQSVLKKELPEIDVILGTGNVNEIVDAINLGIEVLNKEKGDSVIIKAGDISRTIPESMPRKLLTPKHTAYLKISDGCDNICAYCIIPSLRGKYRSRKMENIVEEAQKLSQDGVKEIILVAQDTTRYGIDVYNKLMLPELLRQLNEVQGVRWIRLLYAYPEMITDELIDTIAKCEKVCNYIDMPIQHSSDEILSKMNRRSTKEMLVTVIKKLRSKIPDITIRTTLIVGFPGEKQEHFADLEAFVKESKFDRLGVFSYSKEEGTLAETFDFQIEERVKEERKNRIMEIQQTISLHNNKMKIGKTFDVIIEEVLENNEYLGRTSADAPEIDGAVYFYSRASRNIGDIVTVVINNAIEYDLMGEETDEFSQ
ncbi:MAG: 30S ribosomal protein S12 methylthiotransferase RimO [Alkaliphilus sp.]|nr:30S ribosomal protein S12 methylthiotransferase RimO [Alkaliphilus transvaalensis]PHS29785.1 MAG: 30S ribosomal protein S12 methylthiotransferase RimO [Alkaliphilus sp.]